jgi:hypothetical protein
MEPSPVFESIYRGYLRQVAGVDLGPIADRLGVAVDGDAAVVPFFGRPHRVSAAGVSDPRGRRPDHAVCVVLCRYLLACPAEEPSGSDWVTFKDFRDAAPFVGGFRNTAEGPVARAFAGRLPELERACRDLGGRTAALEIASDLSVRFEALPRVPLVLLFNDRDEDFPAQCTFLFERRAQGFLDMECLAMAGMALAARLVRSAEGRGGRHGGV